MIENCQTVQAYFFNRAILSFYSESLEEMLKQLDAACIGLLLVGLVFGVGVFLQNSLFTYMQAICLGRGQGFCSLFAFPPFEFSDRGALDRSWT